jgi:hypothetical protein
MTWIASRGRARTATAAATEHYRQLRLQQNTTGQERWAERPGATGNRGELPLGLAPPSFFQGDIVNGIRSGHEEP